ncbi:MAG: MFS transporter [Nitrospinae bacterium]|nr:MFS transporter [Nitrospinota bacterium]
MDLSTSKDGAGFREGWPIILACFLTIFTAYTTAFILGPMLDVMGRDLGLSLTAMGQLAAIIFVPWGIGAPLLAPISDRYGRKPVILIGLTGLSLSSIAISFTNGYLAVAVFRFIAGLSGALVPPTAVALIGDNFAGRIRGLAIGFATAGVAMGLLVGVPSVAFLTDYLGWRNALWISGAFGLALSLYTLLSLPSQRRTDVPSSYLASFAWMRQGASWLLMSGNVTERLMTSTFLTYVSVFLIRTYEISLSAAGSMITAMSVGALIGGLLGGALAGVRRRFLIITALVLLQGELLAFHYSGLGFLTLTIAAGFLFSFFSHLSRAAVMDDLISIAPQARGAIIGFYSTSNQVGLFLGASLGGFAIQWGGFEALSWLVLSAAVLGGGFYGASAWVFRGRGL